MNGDLHSSAFHNAKAALGEFAATLTEEQRTTLNTLLAKFVAQAVLDYKAKRDREVAAAEAARRAAEANDPLASIRRAMRGTMWGA